MAGKRLFAAALIALAACTQVRTAPTAATEPDPLAPLRKYEEARRSQTRFLETPASDRALGADPYDLVAVGDGAAGILRGRDALVLLDRELAETARLSTPRAPSAIAMYRGPDRGPMKRGDLVVTSELEPVLGHYRGATRLADIPLEGVRAARDVATSADGTIHVVEEHDDRLVSIRFGKDGRPERRELRLPPGPTRVVRTERAVHVMCVLDHGILSLPLDAEGFPTLERASRVGIDGPFWSFDAADAPGGNVIIVAGGVEDHPLDRRGGFFGYVDSFVYVYLATSVATTLTAAINVSEIGVVVPKAVVVGTNSALVTGYGSAKMVRLAWSDAQPLPSATPLDAPPGTSAIVATPWGFAAASPLLDSWVRIGSGTPRIVRVADHEDDRDDLAKIGEALFFTDLMAPANKSDGALSRFTCETCHFEGYVDGRTHHTGRGDVHATTKPLLGLFNNRPHFSRALDPDLSSVAENEFRVAGAHSETDPHFSVDVAQTPWIAGLGLSRGSFDQAELRMSLMAFLMRFSHRTNPSTVGRRAFTDEERTGAQIFRDKCEGCHQARAASDDAASRVPFDKWESLVFKEGAALVWGSDVYEKTGVTPYVHEKGARVPSLRRLYKKRPYFTNGSAKDVPAAVARARWNGGVFTHEGTTDG
ncbi:MAG TPA: hypothetical protein VIF62_21880, partial [Labilithrix sp.]